jgi:hypothetical protein
MANPSWQLTGEYFETCSCDFLCPCIPSNLSARPTNGDCNFAMVFHVEQGKSENLKLDGLSFAVVGNAPDIMGKGSWSVGLILDDRATPEQQQALTLIASGQAGGPPAILSGVVGKFLGVETRPIQLQKNGLRRSVSIPKVLEQGCEGVSSVGDPAKPLYIDNTLHPANARLALARATESHLHAFGLNWDDTSGKNNGHFAAFSWQSN